MQDDAHEPTDRLHRDLPDLADAAVRFAASLEEWLRGHGRERSESGARRILLLHRRSHLERLAVAARSSRSIGFYGESQCGKSNLVSRLGRSLGATKAAEGPLMILDASGDRSAPWANEDGGGGIDFARWLNPVNNKEATGVICRFTSDGPEPAQPGHFVARVLSHRDIVASLALGHIDEIVPGVTGLDIARELEAIQREPSEADHDGFMAALLSAWEFLATRRLAHSARLRELEEADWHGFVTKMFLAGKRPEWRPDDRRGSPYQRLAGMLWACQPELDEVYRRLLDVSMKLNGAEEVSISPLDVCRSDGDAGVARASLLDVSYIDGLLSGLESSGGIQVHYHTGRGSVRTLGLSRSALVAMIRELILPVPAPAAGGSAGVDILDFPGARKSTPAQDFRTHQQPDKLALQVLRRGKLNQLFLTGVEYQDCSALCLVVSGNGNLEAGPVVKQSLDAWLRREGWASPGSRPSAPRPLQRDLPPVLDPPLVVAVTKADMLMNEQGNRLFGGRLREMDAEYCGGLPWMSQWSEEGPFTRVHWVHNPAADGARSPGAFSEDAIRRIRAGYAEDPIVALHVERPLPRFDALVARPPSDIDDLFAVLRSVAGRVAHEQRVLASILDALEPLEAEVRRDFLGDDRGARVAEERADAARDLEFLRDALASGRNPVSHMLRALQVSAVDVQRACRAAGEEISAIDPVEVGILRFADFYGKLRDLFELRLNRELRRFAALEPSRDQVGGVGPRVLSLQQHFAQLPGALWFRSRVESDSVRDLFMTRNPAALAASPVLGALVSTAWNRGMVWLDRIPPVDSEPTVPPRRRAVHASSDKILDHWRQRLPDVYSDLVDPRRTSLPGNSELGSMRRELHGAIVRIMGQVRHGEAAEFTASLRERLARLGSALAPTTDP